MSYMRVPVCIRKEYRIYYEQIETLTFGHVEVEKWGCRIKERLIDDVQTLHKMHGGRLYALNYPHRDKKHIKFLKMLGFTFFKSIHTIDGERDVYAKDLT